MAARWVPFAYGFRPFFLLAGLFAVVAVGAWLLVYPGMQGVGPGWAAQHWHAHEMLFGFIGAAVAGFLLTAVPSWTGRRGFAGRPLMLLALVWLLGRIVVAVGQETGFALLAVINLLFLPAVMLMIAPALLRSINRNTPLLGVLAALWLSELVFLRAADQGDYALASTALLAGLDIVLLLVSVIGGRIVPVFTANALRRRGVDVSVRAAPWLERLVLAAMIGTILTAILPVSRVVSTLIIALAALLQTLRFARWHALKTLREPIVWILHAAYAWLPIGLALRAAFLAGGFAWAAYWQHALAIGAAATMILAMMTRVSLGHTGRELIVRLPVVIAYLSLIFAVVVRVFGHLLLPSSYTITIRVAGSLWILAFALFLIVYAPILVRPRADGRPG